MARISPGVISAATLVPLVKMLLANVRSSDGKTRATIRREAGQFADSIIPRQQAHSVKVGQRTRLAMDSYARAAMLYQYAVYEYIPG